MMIENRQLAFIGLLCLFMALFVLALWRLIDLTQVETEVKGKYAEILKDYYCSNISITREMMQEQAKRACLMNGYYYPDCPEWYKNFSKGVGWNE